MAQLLLGCSNRVLISLTTLHRGHSINRQTQVPGMLVDNLLMVGCRAIGIERALGCEHGGLVDPEDGQQIRGLVVGGTQTHGRVSHIGQSDPMHDRHHNGVAQ